MAAIVVVIVATLCAGKCGGGWRNVQAKREEVRDTAEDHEDAYG